MEAKGKSKSAVDFIIMPSNTQTILGGKMNCWRAIQEGSQVASKEPTA